MRRSFCFCMLISLMLLGFSSTVVSQFGSPVPMYPQEMDGPVNVINRALYLSETDLAFPGRGLGIEFTRYYNSDGLSMAQDTHMGHDWSHSYQWQIMPDYSTNYYSLAVIIGSGSKQVFSSNIYTPSNPYSPRPISWYGLSRQNWHKQWQTRVQNGLTFTPKAGVRATLKLENSGTDWAFIYTTRGGISYKFETVRNPDYKYPDSNFSLYDYVLTEISDRNGNSLKLHYEVQPANARSKTRLVAVEDTQGRILKFYYDLTIDDVDYPRYITKIEFGLGTPAALTTVYQTVKYSYARYRKGDYGNYSYYNYLTSVAHQLGSGDPRGTALATQYEYNRSSSYDWRQFGYLSAVVSPLGYRTEFYIGSGKVGRVRVEDAPNSDGTDGAVLYERIYWQPYNRPEAFNMVPGDSLVPSNRKYHNSYNISSGLITRLTDFYRSSDRWTSHSYSDWSYSNRNITRVNYIDIHDSEPAPPPRYNLLRNKLHYKIYYAGSNAAHNRQMGNPTKWEQYESSYTTPSVLSRKWEADYETTYNRPIWQIDSMGHRTEFTYDANGNLTEQRSKANTGTQPHAVDHDIVTTHTYDTYGNRIKTTFMPDTTQEKVVETVYDSTHHTYPIEVKTTVTVDGADHIIKTKSEWDTNRGLKTADIDAQGRRTEYAYWQDGKLKYTRRAADNLYTIPTYDKNGNVTQTQVRQTNWQTGTLIAQTKTEYDAMGRAVKAHSFNNNNWATPFATTESTYDIFGDLSQSKDPRSLITNYTRDELGRVTKQTLPDGDWVETRYNTLNQVTKAWTSQTGSETSPAVSNTYDNLNRLSQVSYSTGESVSYTYDLGDNALTQQTNDGSNTYTYTYTHDQLNRVINRNDSLLGYKTFYEYDDASMRKRLYIRPSAGGTDYYDVSYAYDEANRLLSVTDALAVKTASYDYFDIGALKTVTNPNGITAHRTLDTLNRLDLLQYKKNSTTVLSSLDYTYDVKSNVTQLVRNDTGAGGTSKTFSFGYDNISRLTSANYAGNETVSYTYDKAGNRLTQVSSIDGTTTYTVATDTNQLTYRSLVPEDTDFSTMSYTYDAEGKLTQRSEGTDSDAFSYGFGMQLTQIQKTRAGTVSQTLSYAYDGGGQRVKVTDSQGTRYFLYDGLMPVLELDASKNITASYLYGANGVVYRRKHDAAAHWHFDEGDGTVTHDVDGRHNGTLGDGNTNKMPAWSTERGGSLLFDGINDFLKVPDSDALDLVGNKLTISCWVKRSSLTGGYLVNKSDASNGYRLWITSSGAVQFDVLFGKGPSTVTSTTTIPLNQWTHVSARYNGRKLKVFIDGTIQPESMTVTRPLAATTEALWVGYHDSPTLRLHGYIDDVSIYDRALSKAEIADLADRFDGRYEYHHTNALGSNIVLTDDRKHVLVRYEYDVFGAVRSEVGTSDNPRKFTGKEYESDVKLYYFAARYYDPYIGRFTQRDPMGDGVNWYAYTANNPLKFVDPSGLELQFIASGVSITNVSQVSGFDIGRLKTQDQVLFYGLFGTGASGDAGDAVSLLNLDATGDMLTGLINTRKGFTLGWADLGSDVFGNYDDFSNGLRINNHSNPDNKALGYGMTLTALFNTSNPNRDFKSLRITLAHELQHVAGDFANRIPSGVPAAPSNITDPAAWRGEYSAYRTEFRTAHQLGQLSAGYFSAAAGPRSVLQAGPAGNTWDTAIRRASTSGIR